MFCVCVMYFSRVNQPRGMCDHMSIVSALTALVSSQSGHSAGIKNPIADTIRAIIGTL